MHDLMTRAKAAEYLGTTEKTLATWASTKKVRVPYIKLGRAVRYSRASLDEFIERQTRDRLLSEDDS